MAICLVQNSFAQDSHWNGTTSDTTWNNANNWNPVGVPPSGGAGFVGNVWLDAANGDSVMTIPIGDVESPGVPPAGSTETHNTIFGPEWGTTLNIYGSLTYDWMFAPVQNYWPNGRSMINLYNGSSVSCVGASGNGGAGVGIGYAWWWYADAPYVTMNMYGNATLIEPNIALGGHLNIYDSATVWVGANVFTGNPLNGDLPGSMFSNGAGSGTGNQGTIACSDVTASLNLGGGTIVLPLTYTNETTFPGNSLYDLIARGVLRVYGKGFDTNDLVLTYNVTNTFATNIMSTNVVIVTTAPLGTLSKIYFQPLLGTPANTLSVGTVQQAWLAGDYSAVSPYSAVTGVLLSSPEPGFDLNGVTPTYSSSNPSVLTVDANGIVTTVSAGTSTLTASYGGKNSPALTVTVVPVSATLVHRYSFNETSGTTASDSVGGADGTLTGTAVFNGTGQVVLDGSLGSAVQLPAGILTNMDEVTIELWATFPGALNSATNLFSFGNTDDILGSDWYGAGYDYVACSPHTGLGTVTANFGQGDPGYAGEFPNTCDMPSVLDNTTNVQVVCVWHPLAGTDALYTNGVLVASSIIWNDLTDPVAYQANGSILKWQMHEDPLNYIGESLYTDDGGLLANIDEFRIYNGPLTAAQIAADNALGPNQLRGTSTSVSLSINGSDPVISWPTTSALVQLQSSPTLGPGAVWTPINMSGLQVVGGNYQMTVPTTNAPAFYRLEL